MTPANDQKLIDKYKKNWLEFSKKKDSLSFSEEEKVMDQFERIWEELSLEGQEVIRVWHNSAAISEF
jgi:hypothetical protein